MSDAPEKMENGLPGTQPAENTEAAAAPAEPVEPSEQPESSGEIGEAEPQPEPTPSPEQSASEGFSTIFDAPSPTKGKGPKKSPKHRMLRNVIAAIVILLVLAGAVFAIYRFVPVPEDETVSASSQSAVPLISMSTTDVARVDITNETGSYAIYPTEDETEGASTNGLVWHIENIADDYLDNYSISGLADAVASVQAMRRIGEDSDLAQYGLDQPRITATVTGKDEADSYVLYFGDDAPNGSGTYMKLGHNSQIYLATTYQRDIFNRDKTFYADVNMVNSVAQTSDNSSYFDESGQLASFDLITISGKDHAHTMEFIPNPYAESSLIPYIMRSPVTQNVMGDVFDNVFKVVSSGLTADGAFAFYPTAQQIASYGLDDPGTILRYQVGAIDLTLKIGTATEDGYYPVMVNDREIIYKVSTSAIPFVSYEAEDYFSSVLFMDDITSVRSIQFQTPESNHLYSLTHGVDENDAATLEVTCDDKTVNTSDFRNFYQYMLRCPASDFTLDPAPEGVEPSLVLTVNYLDESRPSLVLRFVKQSDRRYHLTVNGTPLGFVAVNTVDDLIGYDQDCYNGVTIPMP